MADRSVLQVTRELSELKQGSDLSLAVACRDSDVRKVKALIIGPPETCYQYGFFEFSLVFPKDYPTNPPVVKAITTDGGKTRFNPNIYSEGKVCLSILGTWRGERGEEWSSAQSLESVLVSIQSLMSSNPYENEPGYEHQESDADKATAKLYTAKIHHETIRISVLKRLEGYLEITETPTSEAAIENGFDSDDDQSDAMEGPFEPFADLCKRRFLWYYHSYLQGIDKIISDHGALVKDGAAFPMMPFEFESNRMAGFFEFTVLKKRLEAARAGIDKETAAWEANGLRLVARESPIAFTMQRQFAKAVAHFKRQDSPLDFEMVDKNPMVWRLMLFGRPMTNLDGGTFKIKIVFSEQFPDEQPRVTVETPLFHQRVSPEGVLCYFPKKPNEICSHIEAVIEAIEFESPSYDPRTLVNPEAASLLWGGPDSKKQYNRKLRRSAQESVEYL